MNTFKLKFFSYHLAISLLVVILLSGLCQFYWYPSPFLLLDGTWIALLTIAIVDIIIGPLLTLILVTSKKSKRELVIDICVIITIQVAALSYGLLKIEQERVWAIVHLDGVFNLVPKKEISKQFKLEHQPLPKYQGMYYGMGLNSEMGIHSTLSKTPLMFSPERYHALEYDSMMATSVSFEKLPKKIVEKYDNNHIFKILIGKKRNAIVILDKKLVIIDILAIANGEIDIPLPL